MLDLDLKIGRINDKLTRERELFIKDFIKQNKLTVQEFIDKYTIFNFPIFRTGDRVIHKIGIALKQQVKED